MRLLALAFALVAFPAAAQSDHHHAHDGHDHGPELRVGAGQAAFQAERHDFGTFREGEDAVFAFRFTNTGTEPITIAEVVTSCGCTTPSYTTTAVAPGATGEVQVAYESTGRPGPFDRTATVRFDGAANPTVTLRITGSVVPSFTSGGTPQGATTFDHDLWDAGEVVAGQPLRQVFQFMNTGTAPVRVTAIRTTPAQGVEVTGPDAPVFAGDVGAILVTVPDAAPLARANGRFEVALSVETTDATQPVKSILIRGRIVETHSTMGSAAHTH